MSPKSSVGVELTFALCVLSKDVNMCKRSARPQGARSGQSTRSLISTGARRLYIFICREHRATVRHARMVDPRVRAVRQRREEVGWSGAARQRFVKSLNDAECCCWHSLPINQRDDRGGSEWVASTWIYTSPF